MRADNTRHIVAAARQRHELTRAKAIQALRTLDFEGSHVTFEAVAQAASVSRSWLYAQPDFRAEIDDSAPPAAGLSRRNCPPRQRSSDASLLCRLEAATQQIRQLTEENCKLRDQLARALGEQRSPTAPAER